MIANLNEEDKYFLEEGFNCWCKAMFDKQYPMTDGNLCNYFKELINFYLETTINEIEVFFDIDNIWYVDKERKNEWFLIKTKSQTSILEDTVMLMAYFKNKYDNRTDNT